MTLMFYDREGRPIELLQWGRLHSNPEYRTVVRTVVHDRVVSTVWLGIDHNYLPGGRPLIFETMVFAKADCEDNGGEDVSLFNIDCWRYATEEEAREHHAEVVLGIRAAHVLIEEAWNHE